jgi:uncharacterized protein GlcG (DUF336 family)
MTLRPSTSLIAGTVLLCMTATASAQALLYGQNVNHDQARKALAAAITEAHKQNLQMTVTVVDTAGLLVAFERMDRTQNGRIAVSQGKAVTAVMYRRSTKLLQDGQASAGAELHLLTLPGLVAVEGGLPFVVDGKVIGAIGVSGGSAEQDGLVARVGIESLTK